MSILIKGINAKEIKQGAVAIVNIDDVVTFVHGDDIVVIPDHGDLISREYAIASACSGIKRTLPTTEAGEDWIRVKEVRQSLKSVPVVIPAERSKE